VNPRSIRHYPLDTDDDAGEPDRPPASSTERLSERRARRVTSVTRRDDRLPPHARISHIGGAGWQVEEVEAIAILKANMNAFFLETAGGTEYLVLRSHRGREYLTTEYDGLVPQTLLLLPACR
jgi:Protein of unknown function (DUF3892)